MGKLLFLVFILSATYLQAQIDKEYFEAIFDEELSDSKYSERENHSNLYLQTRPQDVPSWFINPPIADTGAVYAIGISDPDMDSASGFDMANHRARVIASVLNFGITQLLCDFFLSEEQNTSQVAFEHFSRINTKVPMNGSFELVETYSNAFNETMVLLKYTPHNSDLWSGYYSARFELYKNEIEVSKRVEYESVYEMLLKTKGGDTADIYQLTEFGERYDVLSKQDQEFMQVPIFGLKYYGIPNMDSTDFQYFSHGLWKEYLKSLILNIVRVARLKPENIQYMGGSYQTENYEKLTRGISVNRMRFIYTGSSAFQNELKVGLREVPLK